MGLFSLLVTLYALVPTPPSSLAKIPLLFALLYDAVHAAGTIFLQVFLLLLLLYSFTNRIGQAASPRKIRRENDWNTTKVKVESNDPFIQSTFQQGESI